MIEHATKKLMKRFLFISSVMFISTTIYASDMQFTSTNFKNNGMLKKAQISSMFGCSGKDASPQLSWYNAPKNTKSFAITTYDPDAPTGSGFWHWTIYDINTSIAQIKEGASNTNLIPIGATEALNDYGTKGYLGACPPNGKHRYIFTLYALDINKLPIPDNATPTIIRFILYQHIISKISITTYAMHQ